MQGVLLGHYRNRKQTEARQKKLDHDFLSARNTCRDMDLRRGREAPHTAWFWPPVPKRRLLHDETTSTSVATNKGGKRAANVHTQDCEDEEEDEEEQIDATVGLPIVLNYLRCEHLYCLWCGAHYDTEQEMLDACPGENEDDH